MIFDDGFDLDQSDPYSKQPCWPVRNKSRRSLQDQIRLFSKKYMDQKSGSNL